MCPYYGHISANFDQWGLKDKNGRTVAHAAATWGHIPADFDQWDLTDESGWTVAHEAAYYKHIPYDFSQWGVADNEGRTVLFCLLGLNVPAKYLEKYVSQWDKRKPPCKTDADWEVFKEELPEIYQKYTINEHIPNVADQGALQEALL